MTTFHAILIDECGDEFGVTHKAHSRRKAIEELRDWYPESRLADIVSHAEARRRERDMYRRAVARYENDECYYDDSDY